MKVVSIISFSISSAIVMLSAYLQSHLLIGLDKSLDCWCCCLVENISKQNNNALREREATRRIKQRHVVNETESIGDVTFFIIFLIHGDLPREGPFSNQSITMCCCSVEPGAACQV